MEDIQQQLAAVKEERDKLRAENEKLKEKLTASDGPAPRTKFTNRLSIKKIRERADEGVGLVGKTLVVSGWVKTRRLQAKGKIAFVHLNDGSSAHNLQLVIDSDVAGFEKLKTLGGTGSSLWAKGELVASRGKGQKVELCAKEIEVLGECDPDSYPLAKGKHPLEFLRTIAHLRPRTNTISSMARVRNALAFATHQFFQSRDFLYLHTPLITASDCEGAGEMFQVSTLMLDAKKTTDIPTKEDGSIDFDKDFFGKKSFLTVSGQLNGEIYASALGSIYTFGPTFRAENSHTSRHLAEFWMIEPEMAFADLEDDMDIAEAYLKYCLKYVLENCAPDMEFLDKLCKQKGSLVERLQLVVDTPFKRLTYTEAIETLLKSKKKFQNKVEWGIDLSSEHERFMTDNLFKKPTIVTDYPKDIKAFYMKMNDDGKTVRAMDVLVPGIGEIIGGSQREESLEKLLARIDELDLDEKDYSWYLELRKYGTVEHSGFGLGFERLVCYATGLENIRDAIPFPRYPRHAEF